MNQELIRKHINNKDKNALYDMYEDYEIDLHTLSDAIIEIDESVTDAYKINKFV